MAKLILSRSQKATIVIVPRDKDGNVAPIDGEATFDSSDPGVAEFRDDAGVKKLFAVAPGTCQVNAQADADLGAGVTTITGVLDVEVTPNPATTLDVVAGSVEEQ